MIAFYTDHAPFGAEEERESKKPRKATIEVSTTTAAALNSLLLCSNYRAGKARRSISVNFAA